MNIIVAGGGKVGKYLARELSKKDHRVFLIERRREKVEKLASELEDVIVIHGDACDHEYLEAAQISETDVVIAVTGDDDDNLVICQLAKEIYNVPKVIARVNNPKNEKIFQVLNVDVPISATSIIAKIVEEETSVDELFTVLALKEGQFRIVEAEVKDGSQADGARVETLGLPRDCILIAVERGQDVFIPRGNTVLAAGDRVFALTTPEKEPALAAVFRGKSRKEACDL